MSALSNIAANRNLTVTDVLYGISSAALTAPFADTILGKFIVGGGVAVFSFVLVFFTKRLFARLFPDPNPSKDECQ